LLGLILLFRDVPLTRTRFALLAFAALVLATSKIQHMLLPLTLALVVLVLDRVRLRRTSWRGVALACGALAGLCVQLVQLQREGSMMDTIRQYNNADVVFTALLPAVDDPRALLEEMGIEFSEMEGQDFISGDGVNGPRGMQTYGIVANASYGWGSVGYIASGGAAGFAASNPSDALIDLQHGLKRQYRAGASFVMNDATLGTIRKFKDGQGIYLWAPSKLLEGAVGQLLGQPVVTDDFMPDLGSNTYPIAFGDFKRAYYVIDRKGVSILRDPFTAVPHIKFVARRRVGGGIANFEAFKLFKCATS
jgi:hypothetical protein